MPSISSERVSCEPAGLGGELARRTRRRRPAVAWKRPDPATTKLPESTSSPAALVDRVALAGEQRLVDLEPVGVAHHAVGTGPGRRCAARAGRRARPSSTATSRTVAVAHDRAPRARSAPRAGRASAWPAPPGRCRSARSTTITRPNRASAGEPTTRTTTNSTPRMALKRVKTLARTISPSVRLVRSSTWLTWPGRDPLGDLGAGQPRGRVEQRGRRVHLGPDGTPRPSDPRRPLRPACP